METELADIIKNIIEGDQEIASKYLETFTKNALQVFTFPELKVNNNRTQLWEAILKLAKSTKNNETLANCFTAIRILSREKANLNELITEEWFELIKIHSGLNDFNYIFDSDKLRIAVEVQKSLCNIIFNSSVAAAMCCKNGILQKLTERMKIYKDMSVPDEMKFFDVKLIFLLTALCSEIRDKVKTEMDGIVSLIHLLESSLKSVGDPNCVIKLNDEQVDLVCEILKALFNLTLRSYGQSSDEKEQNQQLVKLLRIYLLMPTNSKEKTLTLQNNIINLMTNMPTESYKFLITPVQAEQNISTKLQFEGQNMTAFYEILRFLKEKFVEPTGVSKQYEILSPVISVLLKCANSERSIRKYLRLQILPPLKDVHHRPEQGSTLRNHLCKLLTSPMTQLSNMVAELLFVLCKMNVNRMIKYTGYGNAAGLFAQRGLLGGRSDEGEAYFSSDSEDSETEEYAEFKHGINPVTGCYEAPHANAMDNMTEEQKEYEAMKLVELIDNLTKCGAIKPCKVGPDGKPHPIEHVLELQGLKLDEKEQESDSD